MTIFKKFSIRIEKFTFKSVQCLLYAARKFNQDQCFMRASSLTLYTLLSIVPVMAMIFGVAKGFGVQKILENRLFQTFQGQEENVARIIAFSENLLKETKGSVITLLGILLLFYAVIKMFGHIEDSFNKVHCVKRNRTFVRKFTDYTALFFTAPFLIIFSGSITIFLQTRLAYFMDKFNFADLLAKSISLSFNLLPFLSVWILFVFFYIFIPNTRVNFKTAAAGGVLAGTLYQILQILYLKFQVGVSQYNAIYGSFAALPLFLIWLQSSWIILLTGAEFSYALENIDILSGNNTEYHSISLKTKKILILRIVLICVRRFKQGEPALTYTEISGKLKTPVEITRRLLLELTECGVLAIVKKNDGLEGYLPAKDIGSLSIMGVISAFEEAGEESIQEGGTLDMEALTQSLEKMESAAGASEGNRFFKEI